MVQDQKAYTEQYDELYKRYTAAEERLAKIEKSIQGKEARIRQIDDFITAVEKMPNKVTEFQNDLWATLVDHVTVYRQKEVVFTMTNGMEIKL